MATLHIIRSPSLTNFLPELQSLVAAQDAILLMDDGCYQLALPALKKLTVSCVYVVREHMQARAVVNQEAATEVLATTTPSLLFDFNNSITWQ